MKYYKAQSLKNNNEKKNLIGDVNLIKHNLDGQIERLHDIKKQTVSLKTNYHQFAAYLFPEVKLLLLDVRGHPAVLCWCSRTR